LMVVAGLVAGCANTGGGGAPGEIGANKSTAGTLLGAAGGGLLGAQFGHGSGALAMTALGTLVGGFLGHEAGTSLDRADQTAAAQAEQRAAAAPIGQGIVWSNPDTGHSGSVTPISQGVDAAGRTCREFQTKVDIGGKTESAYGTACRQADGSWKVAS